MTALPERAPTRGAETSATERPSPVVARCGEPGCEGQQLEACAYVDSRGRSCRTHWCARHGSTVGGLRYCRRHAGTMGALGSKANNPRALPDVGYRGASLVRWMYRDLDARFTALLESLSTDADHLLRDSEVGVSRDESGRRWEMGWKLASPVGVRLRISLMVDETDDATIHVRVGDEVIASGTPPWIEARRRGLALTEAEDSAQRRQFYAFIGDFLADALAAPG